MKKRLQIWGVAALAVGLVLAVLPFPASARGADPQLVLEEQKSGRMLVVLEDLPEGCCGVQITLTLEQEDDQFTFDPLLEGAGRYHTIRQEGDEVTLYLTSKTVLAKEERLVLGWLSEGSISQASGLKLLDSGAELLYEQEELDWEEDREEDQEEDSSSNPQYDLSIAPSLGGSVTANRKQAASGSLVTLTVNPNPGWQLSELIVTGKKGAAVTVSSGTGGKYTFRMPGADVQISAVFIQVSEGTGMPFSDLEPGSWYESAVEYVWKNGLMNGISASAFSPSQTTTRGMIVTILHRMSGEPDGGNGTFTDLASGAYYRQAVHWAAANGIVTGYGDGRFGPDDPITREQLAEILYRYARLLGMDLSIKANLTGYADYAAISAYALEALSWANGVGLMQGVGENRMSPGGFATRAEVATLLMRFSTQLG